MTDAIKKRLPALSLAAGLILAALLGLNLWNSAVADDAETNADDATTEQTADDAAEDATPKKAPIPVRTAALERGRVSSYITATANLVAENEVRVIAEWEGRLAELRVAEGDRVEAGQVLAVLAQTDSAILLEKASVRTADARQKLQRSERLAAQELISEESLDKARMDQALAEQELAEAEWRLEKTYIRAPFSGRLTARMAQQGQHIRPGDELFTVTDFDPLIARIYLPEKDVLQLQEGRTVRITLKADDTIAVDGRIRQISPVVDTATGTVKVTVEAAHPPRQVRPGAFVRVDVVRDTRADAVLVPREAVVRELQKAYVFVAKDGVAEKRTVTLGLEEDGRFEAVDGLASGERVITAGQGGLKDGAAVKLLDGVEQRDRIAAAG